MLKVRPVADRVVTVLDEVVPANLPAVVTGGGAVIDLNDQRKKLVVLKIEQLEEAWNHLFSNYIEPAIWDVDHGAQAHQRVREVVRMFDKAMIQVGGAIGEHQRVVRALEALGDAVREQPTRDITDPARKERFERRKQRRIRKHSAEVIRAFKAMNDKAGCPAWLERQFRKLVFGDVSVKIDPAEVEPLRAMARASMTNFSHLVGEKTVGKEISQAFATLALPAWANSEDVDKQHTALMKKYHPDIAPGRENAAKAAEVNAARDVLMTKYFRR
jgi:hypothetical protein